jgi:hypothetical protein
VELNVSANALLKKFIISTPPERLFITLVPVKAAFLNGRDKKGTSCEIRSIITYHLYSELPYL